DGAIVIGTPKSSDAIRSLNWQEDINKVGPEGFLIRSAQIGGHPVIPVASDGDLCALYGPFHLLRLMQIGAPPDQPDIAERPKVQVRMVDHWDNLNGTIERGYAGHSLWQWNELPDTLSPRYADYARATASLGLNAVALNNVNADFRILTPDYLR